MIIQVMPRHEAYAFVADLDSQAAEALSSPWCGILFRMDGLVVIVEEWGYLTDKMQVSIWDEAEYDGDYCEFCDHPKPDCECVLMKGITHV